MKSHFPRLFLVLLSLIICSGAGCSQQELPELAAPHEPVVTEFVESFTPYAIVDTGVTTFYSNDNIITAPQEGMDFYGQDATYQIHTPSYTDNGDGTITDNVTGLMWQQTMDEKMSYEDAQKAAEECTLGGFDDWRVPTIKELYSLIQFTGTSHGEYVGETHFIDTDYFVQPIGDASAGEREIDAQTWSSTIYTGTTMNGSKTVFGANFVDGRIKGYAYEKKGEPNEMYVRFVRGNESYGQNQFVDNGDSTVTDLATGLMWQQADSGYGMDWQDALSYSENLEYAGFDDWRLPSAKELQSIVDYSRSLEVSHSAAIDPLFSISEITDMNGNLQYPYFWTGTTHLDGVGNNAYTSAVYITFGPAQGVMRDTLMDVHGAGAQRSDPKTGNTEDYPMAFGPQGDIRMVYNYVRCVRSVITEEVEILTETIEMPIQSISRNNGNKKPNAENQGNRKPNQNTRTQGNQTPGQNPNTSKLEYSHINASAAANEWLEEKEYLNWEEEKQPAVENGFSFAIQADTHMDEETNFDVLQETFKNIVTSNPSFILDLGDTLMMSDLSVMEQTPKERIADVEALFAAFGDLPVSLINGNHDGENGVKTTLQETAQRLRNHHFPNPFAGDRTFTGNVETANYYAFEKENVLFVVLDPYTYMTNASGEWNDTLGETQYQWLEETLESSTAKYKFVFIHNLLGGINQERRGGAEAASLYEWGGENLKGVDEFDTMRPGWSMPVHDLLMKYDVDAVFHGHDHLYAREELDGIAYIEVPQPGTVRKTVAMAEDKGYGDAVVYPSAGYLYVVATEDGVTIEYRKTVQDGGYTIADTVTVQ